MKKLLALYPKYKWGLLIFDLVLLNSSFIITHQLKSFLNSFFGVTENINLYTELGVFLPFSLLVVVYFQYSGLYKIQEIHKPQNHIFTLLKTLFLSVIGLIAIQFFMSNSGFLFSRRTYIYFFFISGFLFTLLRIWLISLIQMQSGLQSKVVLVGAGKKGLLLAKMFSEKFKVLQVIGFLDDNIEKHNHTVPILGKIKDAKKVAKEHNVDFFILSIDNISRVRLFAIVKLFLLQKLNLSVSSDYLKILYAKLPVDSFNQFGLIRVGRNNDVKFLQYVKRAFDILLTTIGIILLSPFFITLALAVKLSSKGPIIYKQTRIGKNGQPFFFYKFRSMYVGSDRDNKRDSEMNDFIKGNGVGKKIVNKSSITPVGHFIRKYSLDELPQLFNVLKGDMSLVGPRPCTQKEWNIYEDWQKVRLANTTPGCTGVWQVFGRSEVDFEESVLMDVYYNQNHTPWMDFQLIMKTIPVMLLGKGGE